jgi:hypothetical protein
MTIFSDGHGKVIDANQIPVFRLIGIGLLGLVLVILFSIQ